MSSSRRFDKKVRGSKEPTELWSFFAETTLGELKKKCRKTYIRICKNERELKPEWNIIFYRFYWQDNAKDISYQITNAENNKVIYGNKLFLDQEG